MLYVMFEHGVTYVRVGVCERRVDNVWLPWWRREPWSTS